MRPEREVHGPNDTAALAARIPDEGLDALATLFVRMAPSLHAWAALRIRSRFRHLISPEDLVQDVWMRASQLTESYDPERASFRAWLFRVAKYVLLETYRRLDRDSAPGGGPTTRAATLREVPDEVTQVSRRAASAEGVSLFLERVGELSEQDRQLLVLCGLEDRSRAEAAERLGLSPAAANKRLQRLRTTLVQIGELERLLEA